MPFDSTPRSAAFLISMPFGIVVPTVASGAFNPSRAFGAPQTMVNVSPAPTATWHTRSLSAFGCGSQPTISRDDDAIERRTERLDAFDFEPGHGQPMHQCVAVDRNVDEFAQPVFGEFHGVEPGLGIRDSGLGKVIGEASRQWRFTNPQSPIPSLRQTA